MSAPCSDDPDILKSPLLYQKGQFVQVCSGDQYVLGSQGVITHIIQNKVFVQLKNGIHVNGPYTKFKLIK